MSRTSRDRSEIRSRLDLDSEIESDAMDSNPGAQPVQSSDRHDVDASGPSKVSSGRPILGKSLVKNDERPVSLQSGTQKSGVELDAFDDELVGAGRKENARDKSSGDETELYELDNVKYRASSEIASDEDYQLHSVPEDFVTERIRPRKRTSFMGYEQRQRRDTGKVSQDSLKNHQDKSQHGSEVSSTVQLRRELPLLPEYGKEREFLQTEKRCNTRVQAHGEQSRKIFPDPRVVEDSPVRSKRTELRQKEMYRSTPNRRSMDHDDGKNSDDLFSEDDDIPKREYRLHGHVGAQMSAHQISRADHDRHSQRRDSGATADIRRRESSRMRSRCAKSESESERESLERKDSRYSGRVQSLRRKKHEYLKLERYDGSTSLEAFLIQFENCADYNNWSESDRLAQLKGALRGQAAQILLGDAGYFINYEMILDELKHCYGAHGQELQFENELRMRRRRRGESLRALYRDIHRLVLQAFPGNNSALRDKLAVRDFLTSLNDTSLALKIKDRQPKTLREAFELAQVFETNQQAIENNDRPTVDRERRRGERDDVEARAVTWEEKQLLQKVDQLQKNNEMISNRLAAVESARTDIPERRMMGRGGTYQGRYQERAPFRNSYTGMAHNTNTTPSGYGYNNVRGFTPSRNHVPTVLPGTRPVPGNLSIYRRQESVQRGNDRPRVNERTCERCGMPGHTQYNCRQRNVIPERHDVTTNNSTAGLVQLSAACEKHQSTGIRNAYLNMELEGIQRRFLVDSGCDTTMIPSHYVHRRVLNPTEKRVNAANGTEIELQGELQIELSLGCLKINTTALVSDFVAEGLLGHDFLADNDCYWGFRTGHIMIRGEIVLLSPRNDILRCNRAIMQESITGRVVNTSDKGVVLKADTVLTNLNDVTGEQYDEEKQVAKTETRQILSELSTGTVECRTLEEKLYDLNEKILNMDSLPFDVQQQQQQKPDGKIELQNNENPVGVSGPLATSQMSLSTTAPRCTSLSGVRNAESDRSSRTAVLNNKRDFDELSTTTEETIKKMYTGPLLVSRELGPVNVAIQQSRRSQPMVVHIDKLKPCLGDTPSSWLSTGDNEMPEEGTPEGPEPAEFAELLGLAETDEIPEEENVEPFDELPVETAPARPRREKRRPEYLRDFVT